ncbi:hypothetical protein JW859_08995 [bacterium]|nr:hypothetical protein [bacterium]
MSLDDREAQGDLARFAQRASSRLFFPTIARLTATWLLLVSFTCTGCGERLINLNAFFPIQNVTMLTTSHPDSLADSFAYVSAQQQAIHETTGVLLTNQPSMLPALSFYYTEAQGISNSELKQRVTELAPQFELYPDNFFQTIGLRYIFLADNISIVDRPVGGLATFADVILLDNINAFVHEVHHIADMADGNIHNDNRNWQDQAFAAEKAAGYDADAAPDSGSYWLTRGFINWYGATGIDEDQATYGELYIGSRFDDLLILVTGVGEYTWGNAAKQEALAKLKEMSENCEISPAVAIKLQLTEDLYDHLFTLAAGEE